MKRFKILLLGMLTLSMLSSCFPSPEEPSAPVTPPSIQTETRELPDEKVQLPESDPDEDPPPEEEPQAVTYVLNTNTMKFHKPTCRPVKQIKPQNRLDTVETREEVAARGYSPCGNCKP